MKKLIAQGAEAKIFLFRNKVIKQRIKKEYRLPEIDSKLRKERTRIEAKLIRTLERAGVLVPAILREDDKEMILELEFLAGEKVREYLDKTSDAELCKQIGELAGKMHSANVVHGDLTTSNLILREPSAASRTAGGSRQTASDRKVYLIDLGLGEFSERIEDKAVDLHLFKECLVSKHHSIWQACWKEFLAGYTPKQKEEILKRLEVVEKRGRYKQID